MQIEDIKLLVDSSDSSTNATREEASQMLFFGRANQWDDWGYTGVQLEYRGQFDIIKPKRNKILAELWQSPPAVQYKAEDGADPDTAETLMGMYRKDMTRGEEAIETMIQDQVDCGFGAFRFNTEYESNTNDLDRQLRIKPTAINEANNTVYMDSNAKTKDKSDARWGLIITTFTDDGWKSYCKEVGIDWNDNKNPEAFKTPNTSRNWLWGANPDNIKIGEFYHRERKRERVLIFEDPLGQEISVLQKELKSRMEELDAGAYTQVGSKYNQKWVVTKYIVDGSKILKKQHVPGEFIPIVCAYGDWSFLEGRELWRGIYYDAQDGQRLHNALMSYTADIVMKGPRKKPILTAGMIQGKEVFWNDAGPDDNFPYRVINDVNAITQQPVDVHAINYTQPPEMPQAQAALMQYVRQSVDEVTGTTIDANAMMNGAVTEGQVLAAKKSSNMESFLYQNSLALATKQAGRIYASMQKEIQLSQREITIRKEDGTEDQVTINESLMNYETGEEETKNDLSKGSFGTYVDTGPNYSTLREEAEMELAELSGALQGTPEGQMLLLSYLSLKEAPGFSDVRKWARDQLILQGIKEPETDDEKAMVEQAQQAQGQQQDPNMALAQAEQAKADADMAKVQADVEINSSKVQVDAFNAETKRIDVMASNNLKQVDAAKKASEIQGNELDNLQKLGQALTPMNPL